MSDLEIDDGSSQGSSHGSSQGNTIIERNERHLHKAGGIILSNNKLVIIKGRQSGKWGVPKGSLDDLDESVLLGALREIYEETGLKLKIENDTSIEYWMVYKCRLYLFNLDQEVALNPQDTNEIIEARWLDLTDTESINAILNDSTKMLKNVLRKLSQRLKVKD